MHFFSLERRRVKLTGEGICCAQSDLQAYTEIETEVERRR